jgi:hypothetical protein
VRRYRRPRTQPDDVRLICAATRPDSPGSREHEK